MPHTCLYLFSTFTVPFSFCLPETVHLLAQFLKEENGYAGVAVRCGTFFVPVVFFKSIFCCFNGASMHSAALNAWQSVQVFCSERYALVFGKSSSREA